MNWSFCLNDLTACNTIHVKFERRNSIASPTTSTSPYSCWSWLPTLEGKSTWRWSTWTIYRSFPFAPWGYHGLTASKKLHRVLANIFWHSMHLMPRHLISRRSEASNVAALAMLEMVIPAGGWECHRHCFIPAVCSALNTNKNPLGPVRKRNGHENQLNTTNLKVAMYCLSWALVKISQW